MKFKREFNLSRKFSKFPDGDLYTLTIPMEQHDKYSLITQASKSFYLQTLYTFMLQN